MEYLQYNPIYEFRSDRSDITLQLTDSYQIRKEILGQLKRNANNWFELALGRAPMELQSTLQVNITILFWRTKFQVTLPRNIWLFISHQPTSITQN
jgi:hypothetical protein